MDASITGADKLAALAKALKTQGDVGKAGRKELLRGIRRSVKPLTAGARASALATLPRRGGLATVVAKSRFATRSRLDPKGASVRLSVVSAHDMKATDQGRVRHPTFGRPPWTLQAVPPGWFSRPMDAGAPRVRAEVQASVETILTRIAKEGERG